MPTYHTNHTLDTINWPEITELFRLVGWNERGPADIKRAFEQSSHIIIAMKDEQVIGFGRTVDDGKFYALIVDVVVRPSHQGQGIGTHIVTYLKDALQGYKFVTLTAAPGKDGFYLKLGWKKQKSAYLWPADRKQEFEHCE